MAGARRASRIHAGLTGDRTLVGKPYLADQELRAEYARDIAPRTAAALAKILRNVFPQPGRVPRRVLDLGAGTGAAGVAVRAHFTTDIDLTSVDRIVVAPATRIADVMDPVALARIGSGFDLVIAAHVLNELYTGVPGAEREALLAVLVRRWCETLLAGDATLILIEPALRETSRVLLGVRDGLLAAGLHVVAPCFFTGPCPALRQQRDWCHDSAPGARGHRVDFSYLVLGRTGRPAADATLFRIVSDPIPEKGRLRIFACGIPGRHAVVRLDRHATKDNADLDRLARGDVARIAGTTPAGNGLRVGPETGVEATPDGRR